MCSIPALANICGVMGADAIPYLLAITMTCFSAGLARSVYCMQVVDLCTANMIALQEETKKKLYLVFACPFEDTMIIHVLTYLQ